MTVAARPSTPPRAARTPRGRLRRGLALAGAAVLALWPRAAAAQEPAGRALTVEEALGSALERGAPVRLARERLSASQGGARAARGAFDPVLRTTLASSREHTLAFDGDGAPAVSPSHTTGVTYEASLEKRFRSGVVVGPRIEATRTGVTPAVEARNNVASASLVAQVPLARGRGAVNTLGERAAEREVRSAGDELLHARARAVLDAALAYWAYAAAAERLEAQRQAEARARKLVEETRVLVAAEERPAADLNQLRANLASKEASRIAAEQAVVAARQALGLAMGTPAEEIARLPLPSSPFPAPGAEPADAGALATQALARRADLRAARGQVESATLRAGAAANEVRPRVDLSVSVGYTGAEPGRDYAQLVTPFYRSWSSWSAALELTWERAAGNALARGQAEQAAAARRQREVEADELAREIRSGVAVAAEALRHGRMELERAEEAVRLWGSVVEAEERKFALGMSTLFDVIQAEDGLTGALVARVGARERYAAALARLAFETGALVDGDGALAAPSVSGPR